MYNHNSAGKSPVTLGPMGIKVVVGVEDDYVVEVGGVSFEAFDNLAIM